MKSARGHTVANALTNASGLVISKIGSFLNFVRYRLMMDNSERGGSLKNIHAHYDLSNDLFTSFLDKETLMYSSAIYDAVAAPPGYSAGVVLRGTLEQAQWRKLDTLLDRAQVKPGQAVLGRLGSSCPSSNISARRLKMVMVRTGSFFFNSAAASCSKAVL